MSNHHSRYIFPISFLILPIYYSLFPFFCPFLRMLKKLQEHWKVSALNMWLILTTFALGGSLCGRIAHVLLSKAGIGNSALWFVVYLVLVTLLWPLCVLLISYPLGQFKFFKLYVGKLMAKITGKHKVHQLAIFASGAGSNAFKIIEHFNGNKNVKIALVVCNKPEAGVLQIAAQHNIPTLIIDKATFYDTDRYVATLQKKGITFIVLAGFLWKMPEAFIKAYTNKIINIHPALLPHFGGKGMYGRYVHEAVIIAKESKSGITIHYVDEEYDHGSIIFQASCEVRLNDTPDSLAAKIHSLEHTHFSSVIEQVLQKTR